MRNEVTKKESRKNRMEDDLWTDPENTKREKGGKDEKKREKDSTEKKKEGRQ